MYQHPKKRSRFRNTVVLFLSLLILLSGCLFIFSRLYPQNKTKLNDIEKTLSGYFVTGDAPYIEYDLKQMTDIRDIKIRISGFNCSTVSMRVVWDYDSDDEKTRDLNITTIGQTVETAIDEEGQAKSIRIVPALNRGDIFEDIAVSTLNGPQYRGWWYAAVIMLAVLTLVICIWNRETATRIGFPVMGDKLRLAVFLSVLICMMLILYHRYIFDGYYLIFHDIGNDSIEQFYPGYIDTARRLTHYGWGGGWNPRVGLGESQTSFFPTLFNWFILFGEDSIPGLLTVHHCATTLLAGLFCYLYCGRFTRANWVRWLFAVGYAFSSELVIRLSWNAYGVRAMLLMLWVWLFEMGLEKHRYGYVAVGSALFFINTSSAYYFLLYALLLPGYAFLRVLSVSKTLKEGIRNFVPICIITVALAGICGHRIVYEGITDALHSTRFGSEASTVPFFTSMNELLTGFYRTIGTDIPGIWFDYTGTWNVLEDLALYCGIIAFLFAPVSLYLIRGKQGHLVRVAYLFALIYLCFGRVHYLANGRSSDMSWKTASLWIAVLNIYTCVNGFDSILRVRKEDRRLLRNARWVFNTTVVIFLGILIVGIIKKNYGSLEAMMRSMAFILIYSISFNVFLFGNHINSFFRNGLVMLACVEAILMSFNLVNHRFVITQDDLVNRKYYADYTVDALDAIKDEKMVDTFRINKTYDSVALCDSMGQSFMGSKAYRGGTGASDSIAAILEAYELPTRSTYKVAYGSGLDHYFDEMIGTKYVFSRSPNLSINGYTLKTKKGDVYIYENTEGLPLVFTYDKVYDKARFLHLDTWKRSRTALSACVIEGKTGYEYFDVNEIQSCDGLEKIDIRDEEGFYRMEPSDSRVLAVVKYENEDEAFPGILGYAANGENHTMYVMVSKGASEVYYEIPEKQVSAVFFREGAETRLKQIHCYRISENYYEEMNQTIEMRKRYPLVTEYQDDNSIIGHIEVDKPQILFASIPYDTGWHIYIDGKAQKVLNVNCGFLGCELKAGKHDIRIVYETDGWLYENLGKLSAAVLAVMVIIIERIRRGHSNVYLSRCAGI